jgi:short-subunit dehydrogenase
MKNNLVILGYGPGISKSIAYRFGREKFTICLVARNKSKLDQAVSNLRDKGIEAYAFQCDLSDLEQIPDLIGNIKATVGSIKNILWNAFNDSKGDLLQTSPSSLTDDFHIRVSSYVAMVQACLPDLDANNGSILSTNGIFALDNTQTDSMAYPYASLAIPAAAQNKTTNLLMRNLSKTKIFVGQVIVNGFVTGTAGGEKQNYTVHPDEVAQKFWEMYSSRTPNSMTCGQLVDMSQNNYIYNQ